MNIRGCSEMSFRPDLVASLAQARGFPGANYGQERRGAGFRLAGGA
jgi:hypothetical protein